nr:midasin [Quercus suber]
MECFWDSELLQLVRDLPPELLEIVRSGDNNNYLTALAKSALNARNSHLLFAYCEDVFAHLCAVSREHASHASLAASVAFLGRIIPFASYLAPYATELLSNESYSPGKNGNEEEDLLFLLGLFRLLKYDRRTFVRFVPSLKLTSLLEDTSRPVTYIAIRILQIQLNGADHWFEQMLHNYLGPDTAEDGIDGLWDSQTIDYRFLTLWEERRWANITQLIDHVAKSRTSRLEVKCRTIEADTFHSSTSLIGNRLFPRAASSQLSLGSAELVNTATVMNNIEKITNGLKTTRPLLLTGLAGSGKTTLVRHIAQKLHNDHRMVTLHLNEQSDAKLLVGIYTTGDKPGTFVWRPGVLTTAVQEGRWVLIEDLDRAPNEIMGTLLSLIERRELLIPNRKHTIHAAPGFRIIGTVRSTVNHRGEEIQPLKQMLGARHWQSVNITMPTTGEQSAIARQLYPNLAPLLPQFLVMYERIRASRHWSGGVGQSRTGLSRSITPRDFLKWCHRSSELLKLGAFTSKDMDNIFLEAIDCFAGALPDGEARSALVAIMAEELRIDPQRRDFLLHDREIRYTPDTDFLYVGRYCLPRVNFTGKSSNRPSLFSTNPHTCRMLERTAAAVVNREPLLLVGETGVGKTTAVQHLATYTGKKLEPFNLSQQSEAGDILGGFKPVTVRSLVVPMKDEFDELFSASFSISKNQRYLDLLQKQFVRSNWKAVCTLWRQALQMVDQQRKSSPPRQGEAPSKKRKTESKRVPDFGHWDVFAAKVVDLERRLVAGKEAFAFSFIEGNLVRAVRNGDWVLLDEINLASPDTLEAIADLLDPKTPSLLLTEAGQIERVEAHSDFRLFAAMNPATDVGKKDLPAGIRSRFSELYVESPDKDLKSLQSIVRTYLHRQASADEAVAVDVSICYQKIIVLAEQNKLVDGAGQKPHFSLRTLTRTLSYARYIAPQCSIRRALFEGFQMSFLTFLDAESASLIQPVLEKHLFGKRINVHSELQKPLRKPEDEHQYAQGFPGSKHWVRLGRLQLQEQAHYILTPFIRRNLENLVRATSTRRFPVLIQGPTSSGKTSMIEYLAVQTGHRFVRINNHEHTDLQEYLGTYVSGSDGRLNFQEGILVQALREGHWIVLDELNLAPTDVLEALNRLLDDNRELFIPETQETVRPHNDFMLFATQNPAGVYGGRKALSRAFRNRFLELHFDDIPVDELQEILHRRTQLPESRCKRIVNVYRELSVLRQENRLFEQKSFATLRDLFRWALRRNDTIEQLAANGFMLLAERVRKAEEREALKTAIERVMSAKGARVIIDESSLYAQSSPELQNTTNSNASEDVVWTKAMRRLYVLVSRAIANNEPVLLVGDTGCGKTTVCQILADVVQKTLHTVNAHQNTETSDLIGSQRPVRNRAATEAHLKRLLLSCDQLHGFDDADSQSTSALVHAYERAVVSLTEVEKANLLQTDLHKDIQASRTRLNALFEWTDGSLIQAMRAGSFFLMDEISLADDSVLERINSVLESQRSILLAEKGSSDAHIKATPGFQFFATMNPGGDYGKRELSPALRNRFTEIWVPPLSDTEDMIQIVAAKLATPAKHYAGVIVSFSRWFKRQYNTSANESVSIRDILAWVTFINAQHAAVSASAVLHGAAMVYIDTLGANPAGLMTVTGSSLADERLKCLAELGRLLQLDATTLYFVPIEVNLSSSAFDIGPFSVQRRDLSGMTSAHFTFDASTSRSNAMRVVRAMQLPKSIMLEGSPGVGKTALITAIAHTIGIPLTRINLSEQTDLLDLFGSDAPVEGAEAGTFAWQDAPFLRAMKNGDWVLLDEMNLASQAVLEGLNACLDHRGEVYIPELDQTLTKHPEFRLFAAQNPHHQGGGRKGLPASFVNRFTVVYADSFKSEDLMRISQSSFPDLDLNTIRNVVEFVDTLGLKLSRERSFQANGGPWEFNLRDITRWLSLASSNKAMLRAGNSTDFANFLLLQRFRSPADREYANRHYESIFTNTPPLADVVSSISSQVLQFGVSLLPRDPTFSDATNGAYYNEKLKHDLVVLQSVMLCVQQRWPVVLTGASGSGKTSLISRLAVNVGAVVSTIAMNAETDSIDLIGGYEQADSQRHLSRLFQSIRSALEELTKSALIGGSACQITNLLALPDYHLIAGLRSSLKDIMPPEIESLLGAVEQTSVSADKARFEWVDGVLIEALEMGHWVILDNANLCSASVLDRLNSLLEPNGELIINEHANSDGAPRILRPHHKFRIFLTVDPKHGELSRAMRNRAVELFLHARSDAIPLLDPLQTESAIARFMHLNALTDLPHTGPSETLFNTVFGHFGLQDQVLHSRLDRQIEAGLFKCPPIAQLICDEVSYKRRVAFYERAISQTEVPADFANIQTLHPLNNQPLIEQSSHHTTQALLEAMVFDVERETSSLSRALENIKSNQALSQKIKRIERAVIKVTFDQSKNTETNAIRLVDTVNNSLQLTVQWAGQLNGVTSADIHGLRRAISSLNACWWCLLHTIRDSSLDQATFNAWLSVLSTTIIKISDAAPTAIVPLMHRMNHAFAIFNRKSHPLIAAACESMWKTLRPSVPANMDQLNAVLAFELLVDRFDAYCRLFTAPLETLGKLRSTFVRTLQTLSSSPETIESLPSSLDDLLPTSAAKDDPTSAAIKTPYFQPVFERLCQQSAMWEMERQHNPASNSAVLEILALRPTKAAAYLGERNIRDSRFDLKLLRHVLPVTTMQSDPGNEQTVAQILFGQLHSVNHVTIGSIDLLESEYLVLARSLGLSAHLIHDDGLQALDMCLERLMRSLMGTLVQPSTSLELRSCVRVINDILDSDTTITNTTVSHDILFPLSDHAQQSASWLTSHLGFVATYLRSNQDSYNGLNHEARAAQAWSRFALVALTLYLPAELFDPAIKPHVEQKMYRHVFSDLYDERQALQVIGTVLTGNEQSLRTRLITTDLDALGQEPVVHEVCRPQISELPQLQGDFDSLTRTIQSMYSHSNTFSSLPPGDSVMWSNLGHIRTRLAQHYRGYDDFTEPVVGLIDCLSMARHLESWAEHSDSRSVNSASLAKITPFVEASFDTWQADDTFVLAMQNAQNMHESIFSLSILAIRCSTLPLLQASHGLKNEVENQFSRIYDHWKLTLNHEQKHEMAKSSLYRYRGDEDLREDDSLEELEALFPMNDESSSTTPARQHHNDQDFALQVANTHSALFDRNSSKDWTAMTGILRRFDDVGAKALHGIGTKAITSAMIMSLSHTGSNHSVPPKHSYNIYTDANLPETKKLAQLLRKVNKRFAELHSAWPEHATPVDILRLCEQIETLHHLDSLMQILPHLEKLHLTVNDWQRVASKEFAALDIYEELTDTIIRWRQVELSSWAGLLERESTACRKATSSWWYIAYENIVLATEHIRGSPVELQQHVEGLLKTLGTFMLHCGLGEFASRLDMLRAFEGHLACGANYNPALRTVHEALANFRAYYNNFADGIDEALAKGRDELEKEIRSVVQVASWKDRNVAVLRQSSQTSHKKLLRLVRKYRRLLAQPVGPLIQAIMSPRVVSPREDMQVPDVQRLSANYIPGRPDSIPKHIHAWTARPGRYKNVSATVSLMQAKIAQKVQHFDVTGRLASLTSDLLLSIRELQKATPTTLTDKNKNLVQHLKSRKRRLLADTMKDLKAMGFRSNLSSDILERQNELPVVLAHVPALSLFHKEENLQEAEQSFHQLLSIFPFIRESAQKHSEDLTPAETARSLTILESILHTSLLQHKTLGEVMSKLSILKVSCASYIALTASEMPTTTGTSIQLDETRLRTDCVVNILHIGSTIISAQAQMTNNDYQIALGEIQRLSLALSGLLTDIKHLAPLPTGVQDKSSIACANILETLCGDIILVIDRFAIQHPELEPTLRQLEKWVLKDDWSPSSSTKSDFINDDVEIWTRDLLAMLDQILGSLEDGPGEIPRSPDPEEKSWFTEHQRRLNRQLNSLRIGNIGSDLASLLARLHRFSNNPEVLSSLSVVCQMMRPILSAFVESCDDISGKLCSIHVETNKMAFQLATSFLQLAQNGFCTPSEKDSGKNEKSAEVESGTGLGDGEGAEDISKDVGDDEDLGDLAQEPKSKEQDNEITNEKDAVDMADQEMEGDMDEGEAESGDEETKEKDEGDDAGEVEEETGNVDDLGPTTIDEKMWDEGKDDDLRDKQTDDENGIDNQDDLAAAEREQKDVSGEGQDEMETGADEDEHVNHEELEKTDAHVQEQSNLDLPDDLTMDGDNAADDEEADLEPTPDDKSDDAISAEAEEAPGQSPSDQNLDREESEFGDDAEQNGDGQEIPEDFDGNDDDDDGDNHSNVLMLDDDQPDETQMQDQDMFGETGSGRDQNHDQKRQEQEAAMDNEEADLDPEEGNANGNTGTSGGRSEVQGEETGADEDVQNQDQLPYKQLGDALDEWYRQHKVIQDAQQPKEDLESKESVDMADADFEHLPEAGSKADGQALGTASTEQASVIDEETGLPHNNKDSPEQKPAEEQHDDDKKDIVDEQHAGDASQVNPSSNTRQDDVSQTFIGESKDIAEDVDMNDASSAAEVEDVDHMDEQLLNTHIFQDDVTGLTLEEARALWSKHEANTRNLALLLTEHLRLILQPTQATKMRGDFRTGKRLNIKRIIPYIASSYKRDKIWMRRSVPSKRSYQIMLAIDDSHSMAESGRHYLAFDTLALVAKSMSMLEVGELSVVGFGADVNVAHDFQTPFTTDAGAGIFRSFTFAQSKTDVRKLLSESIEMFRSARLKAAGSASELWQLQLIISDGVCEDHPATRSLVRQAREERIMIVFIVVDATADESTVSDGPKQSILDLQTAEFSKDAAGEMQLKMVKYLDTFPFEYYLIVQNVHELPGVLAGALRQWFAEVIETG